MQKWILQIPRCHFIPVLPQLAARLTIHPKPNSYHDHFPQLLLRLLQRCALEHPCHALPIIIALAFTGQCKSCETPRTYIWILRMPFLAEFNCEILSSTISVKMTCGWVDLYPPIVMLKDGRTWCDMLMSWLKMYPLSGAVDKTCSSMWFKIL